MKNDTPFHNNIIQAISFIKNSETSKAFQNLVVDIMLKFNINFTEAISHMTYLIVNEIYDQHKTKSAVIARTGLKITAINEALSQSKATVNKSDTSTIDRKLFPKIYGIFIKYCNANGVKKMPELIFYKKVRELNPDGRIYINQYIDKLIDKGVIIIIGGEVYLSFENNTVKLKENEYLAHLTNSISFLFSTILNNKNTSSETLFQRRLYTTQVPPKYSEKINTELFDILINTFDQVTKVLSNHEKNVPIGTYPKIGIVLVQINENLNNPINQNKTRRKK